MTIDLEKYQALKKRAIDAQRESDKAEGVLESLRAELLKEFNCQTIAAANALLKKMEWDLAQEEKEFDKKLAAFEKEFGEAL